jgi:DNA-binding transcriptional ArsR family regulator
MSLETRRDVFQAIADPTRRQIIQLIAQREMNLNAIADNFEISRPAISQHIKILTECGLIEIRQQGRERYCEARLDKLSEVQDWTEHYRSIWTKRFQSLRNFLANETPGGNKKRKIKSSKK